MPEEKKDTQDEKERIPLAQVFMDDVFFLLTLGLGVPLILYLVWGVLDLANVPPFRP